MKATFFITYIMIDGWAGIALEIVRLVPLIIYHLKIAFLVKTEKDKEEATNPGCIEFAASEPRIQLYFLLGLVYSTVTPFLLPFILIFFGLAYVVFRHQVSNFGSARNSLIHAFQDHICLLAFICRSRLTDFLTHKLCRFREQIYNICKIQCLDYLNELQQSSGPKK